jgi:hypothetical protein
MEPFKCEEGSDECEEGSDEHPLAASQHLLLKPPYCSPDKLHSATSVGCLLSNSLSRDFTT